MKMFHSNSLEPREYDFIRKLVYDRSRINLGPDKRELVRGRLQKRLKSLGLKGFDAYCQLLDKQGETEVTALVDLISTNVTHFFREWGHFEFLRDKVLPEWERRLELKPKEPMRIWSAACSSGEEPYSVAILLAEFVRTRPQLKNPNWEICASDISSRMLATAREAVYKAEQVKLPEPSWLRAYFQKGHGEWDGCFRVKPEIRSRVRFGRFNLVEQPYPWTGKFDVIFCRNVMIYFDAPTQQQLVQNLGRYLKRGGFLMVGHSENLFGIEHNLKCVQSHTYQFV